ncbi:MAG: adenosylmethionine--8-amino-7-oxononanoate transaminase [Rhizobiales bacterium]|nr:adenosylmethionine--8-amino-7-oxononanoate transaminase [Hyphomicrobiales bacterium]NRB13740.1 adenosylmethionine--8-amino-7-oxononanoate transaminase [Hyphomicrobiales bacterium]
MQLKFNNARAKFNNVQEWLDFDREHLWHPYTSMIDPLPCYPIVGAQDVYLELADGRKLVDGTSSWWSALHGYNHPKLNNALIEQSKKMSHVMFGGIAHQPASELGARLLAITPDCFEYVFLADSGSISIEVALKMALQYWQSIKRYDKAKFLTVRGGYHGDPFTCMSVGDPEGGQHHMFRSVIAQHIYVDRPQVKFDEEWRQDDIAEFAEAIKANHHKIAAVIIEPIMQGTGGMRFYHPEYLRQMRALCDELDVLLIFDEIATGFGRTGKLFAMQHAGVEPDILCVGKALTGGMMTLAATITTKKVAMTISGGETPILMHGPTFMANPLACAVASASIDLLLEPANADEFEFKWQQDIARLETQLQQLRAIEGHQAVADVRILGGIGVVEMHAPVDVEKLQAELVKNGIWVRPFGRLIYVMPPYIMQVEQLKILCDGVIKTIETLYETT